MKCEKCGKETTGAFKDENICLDCATEELYGVYNSKTGGYEKLSEIKVKEN